MKSMLLGYCWLLPFVHLEIKRPRKKTKKLKKTYQLTLFEKSPIIYLLHIEEDVICKK